MLKLTYIEIKSELERILKSVGFSNEKAEALSSIFSENNLLGKESHGLNRFPSFIDNVKRGRVLAASKPELVSSYQAVEQWDGNLGAGPLNAMFSIERACELAKEFGIGCVALKNTNHWMRGGTYGWKAAEKGYISICWTNATPTMPAWGSSEIRIGNNPLVIAIPYKPDPIVLDMALSQYLYGTLEVLKRKNKKLKYYGGFNRNGNLTKDPGEILEAQRALPIGLWKGSGLSLVLDILATVLSGGKATNEIRKQGAEFGVSQVFIAFKPDGFNNVINVEEIVGNIVEDFHESLPINDNEILYPGEQSSREKRHNIKNGISIETKLWERIKKM